MYSNARDKKPRLTGELSSASLGSFKIIRPVTSAVPPIVDVADYCI
jgi:hypothetical protein